MNKVLNFLLLIIILGGLSLPSAILASEYQINGHTVNFEGLIPCGRCLRIPGLAVREVDIDLCGDAANIGYRFVPCRLCHFFVMFDVIIDFLLLPPFGIVPVLGVLMLVIGGIMYIFAAESPERINTAKKLFESIVIGLIIIYGAWVFVSLIFDVIGVADWTGLREGWWMINCPIQL